MFKVAAQPMRLKVPLFYRFDTSGVSTRQSGATPGPNLSEELIQQLFLSVKGICSAVMELTVRMDKAFSKNQTVLPQGAQPQNVTQPPTPANPDPANPPGDYRSVIRQEMREMQERAKRRQSVVIKGMQAQSGRDYISKFGDLSHSFTGTRVELSEVVPIPNHSDLFRAKILDDDHRKLVLDRAKNLRDTEHAHIFIRRDLTYAQRNELRERRAQRNSEDTAHGQGSATRQGPSAPTN